nr:MAG TPA: hypothetical protein [Caudoviricetes sp.]
MMSHIENVPIVGLALCFTMLTRTTRNARLQAMSAMAGFWVVCIFTTRKNKPLRHGTGGRRMGQHKHNPTAIAAKNGELPPKKRERRLTKRQAERLLKAEILSRCTLLYALPPELQNRIVREYLACD